MHTLANRVQAYSQHLSLVKAGDRVGVAVSSGADSVALLRLLLELQKEMGLVLSVVHFNHKLRGTDADTDENFVAKLAQIFRLDFHCESGDVKARAATKGDGIEASARTMRYQFFRKLLAEGKLDRIATAHTLDDQAETVLLRIARGAGTRGLAGIYPRLAVPESPSRQASIVRPLLEIQRKELERYLAQIGQHWREDGSNRDLRYARNRVRHGVLPRLERALNPAVRKSLAEAAEIARAEEEYWQAEAGKLLPVLWDPAHDSLKVSPFNQYPLAMQRRLVRAAGESLGLRLELAHVESILAVAQGKERSANLPMDWRAERIKNSVVLRLQNTSSKSIDYAYALPIPGRIDVPEAGVWFEATLVRTTGKAEYNRGYSLDPAKLSASLQVRNWRAGDRFAPAHSKSPRKIKELLQKRRVTGSDRRVWPVIVSGDEVIWLRGFNAPEKLQPPKNAPVVLIIQEFPLQSQGAL